MFMYWIGSDRAYPGWLMLRKKTYIVQKEEALMRNIYLVNMNDMDMNMTHISIYMYVCRLFFIIGLTDLNCPAIM